MNKRPAHDTGNVPEVVWNQLKLVAARQASVGEAPIEECIKHVEAVILEVIGSAQALPPAVVQFYAEELGHRIKTLRSSAD